MNIPQEFYSVNYENFPKAKKLEIETQILSQICELKLGKELSSFSVSNLKNPTGEDVRLEKSVGHNAECPFSVRKDICFSPADKPRPASKRLSPKDKFAYLYAIEEEQARFFAMLPETYKQLLSNMHFVVVDSLKKLIVIPPNEKGSPSYNKRARADLVKFAQIFSEFYQHCYAITLTVDSRKFSGGVITQHQKAVKYCGDFLRELARRFSGKYICVNEEQKRGAIHFHIELFTDSDLHTGCMRHTRDGKKKYIGIGPLREFCDSHWEWGHFHLEPIEGEKVIFYCVKYISKSTETDFWELKQKGEFKGENKKAIMGFVMPIIGGYRSYSKSRLSPEMKIRYMELQKEWEIKRDLYRSARDCERALKSSKTVFKPIAAKAKACAVTRKTLPPKNQTSFLSPREREIARLRAYLISRSDNSTLPCLKWISLGNFGDLVSRHGTNFRKINALSRSEKRKIARGCSPNGCGGCEIGLAIRDFILNSGELYEKTDNREALKPFLWKVLSPEDKKLFTSFNFVEKEIETDCFGELLERIGELLVSKKMPYFMKNKQWSAEEIKEYCHQKPLSLSQWRDLLTCRKTAIALSDDEVLKTAVYNLFPSNCEPLFNSESAVWSDSGFEEVFRLFKDWLVEQNIFPKSLA